MGEKRIAGLILAAGMSSRMNDFKPLLPLAGKTLIENTIVNMYDGGVSKVVVILGKRADELEPLLRGLGAETLYNADYETTDMFTSVCMGLRYLQGKCDALFFNPGDVPLFLPQTLKEMQKALLVADTPFIRPTYLGTSGHPFLIDQSCIQQILDYRGNDGLRGAMRTFKDVKKTFAVPDKGILLDVDTPDDYQRLKDYVGQREIPDMENCQELCRWFATPERAVRHGIAVAAEAERIRMRLEQVGYHLDQRLIAAGAMLHDVAKGYKEHAIVGANWLDQWGYHATARLVEAHTDLPAQALDVIDERSVVHLADKLVQGDQSVTIEQRFAAVWDRWRDDEKVYKLIEQRFGIAKKLQQKINDLCK